jgi:hypothetical protein
MKHIKLFEDFINEAVELVHVYDTDGSMYGTGELVKTKGKKSLVRWDGSREEWYPSELVKLVEYSIDEGKAIPMEIPNELAYLDFKKYAYKNRKSIKDDINKLKDAGMSSGVIFSAMESIWYKWASKHSKEFKHVVGNGGKFGRALLVMLKNDDLIITKQGNNITDLK